MVDPIWLAVASALLALAAGVLPWPWSAAAGVLGAWSVWRTASFLKVCLEKSERKSSELDSQLLQSQKMAAIGEIAAGIAHEINNPLAVITQETEWLAHLLSQEPPDVTQARSGLEAVQTQVTRCADITRNLLNLARAWKPIRQLTDFNRCIEDMLKLVERGAGPGAVSFRRMYDQSMPPVPLDAPLFRQAALNLLVNAMHAAGKGGEVTVSTGVNASGKAFLSVADNGPGIAPHLLERVFDPFFTTKAPGKGTGLGLSITQRIVDRLGGLISAANQTQHTGAVFTIQLPLNMQTTENIP